MGLIEIVKNNAKEKVDNDTKAKKIAEEYHKRNVENLKKEHAIMRRIIKDNGLWETLLNDDEFVAYLHENDKTNQELK